MTTSAIQPAGTSTTMYSCSGLTAYERAYVKAVNDTFDAHPVASQILQSDIEFTNLTPLQFSSLSGLFTDMVEALNLVSPPPYAAEWHTVQIDGFLLFAQLTNVASESGILTAVLKYSAEMDRVEHDVAESLSRSNSCPEFIVWATEYSWMLS